MGVRTALLYFAVGGTNADYSITWNDFNLLAGDGASNNVATFGLLAQEDPAPGTAICLCHDLARAVLAVLGVEAALDEEDRALIAVLTATMKKMRTLAVNFNSVGKLKTGLHSAQEVDDIKRSSESWTPWP